MPSSSLSSHSQPFESLRRTLSRPFWWSDADDFCGHRLSNQTVQGMTKSKQKILLDAEQATQTRCSERKDAMPQATCNAKRNWASAPTRSAELRECKDKFKSKDCRGTQEELHCSVLTPLRGWGLFPAGFMPGIPFPPQISTSMGISKSRHTCFFYSPSQGKLSFSKTEQVS